MSRFGLALPAMFFFLSTAPALEATMPPSPEGDAEIPRAFLEYHEAHPEQFVIRGGWTEKVATASRQRKDAAIGQKAFDPTTMAVTGTVRVPVFPVAYSDTPAPGVAPQPTIQTILFGANPTGSVTDYYDEISYGLLNLTGDVFAYTNLTQPGSFYEGPSNGLPPTGKVGNLVFETLSARDAAVDFSSYDNDGPDGMPNSGDDDGVVDLVAFLIPERGGECGGPNVWAHRWILNGWSGMFTTNDPASGGGFIRVNDYTIQGALQCDDTALAIGTFAHEMGHIFGIPDLYDTDGNSQGLGDWSLMASGSWNSQTRPAHMTAWEKAELGWLVPTEIIGSGIPVATTVNLDEVENNPEAIQLPIGNGEYFLIENRQPLGFDQNLHTCGLAIYHVDQRFADGQAMLNQVNTRQNCGAFVQVAGQHYGIALEQADGSCQLEGNANRGDAGDLFPGSTGNTAFGPSTNPNTSSYAPAPTGIEVTAISGCGSTMSAMIRPVPLPPPTVPFLDVVFLIDNTGSYGDDYPNIKNQMPDIVTTLQSKFPGRVKFGLATFRDFPFSPVGGSLDYAYRIEQTLTSNAGDFLAAINNLPSPGGGADGPESQYEAVYQALNPVGRDLDGNGLFTGTGEIPPGLALGWGPGRHKVIYLLTDAPFHDADTETYPPGTTLEAVGRSAVRSLLTTFPANALSLFTFVANNSGVYVNPGANGIGPVLPANLLADQARELAELTHGGVFFLGRDSSGLREAMDASLAVIIEVDTGSAGDKLLASDGAAGDLLGNTLDTDGGTIVIGAPNDDDDGASSGSVYVYEPTSGGWTEQAKLTAADATAGAQFGTSVALGGNFLVIGAPNDPQGGTGAGAAYVFARSGDGWVEEAKLVASDPASNVQFGTAVAVDGNRVLVGAPFKQEGGVFRGSAYVFVRSGSSWTQEAKLVAATATEFAQFGVDVDLLGNTALIGAPNDVPGGIASGSAYVFTRGAGGWTQQARLGPSDAATFAFFGFSVALSTGHAAVGAFGDNQAGASAGAVYTFASTSGVWTQQAKLVPGAGSDFALFGASVSLSDGKLLVGAPNAGPTSAGEAYVYARSGETWSPPTRLTAGDGGLGDQLGVAVATDGLALVVAAAGDDDRGSDAGAAYVFGLGLAGPTVSIPFGLPARSGVPVSVPILFLDNGQDISTTALSVDFDETCLAFDPTDANGDGIPDAVTFLTPPGFFTVASYDPSDTDGELDLVAGDVPPEVVLPDGPILTLELTPTCEASPGTTLSAPVRFSAAPRPSFGDLEGRSVPGTYLHGAVTLLPGVGGDCNSDRRVDAGDISADGLEIFDGDGSFWLAAPGSTFAGDPVGCDANADTTIDAGDLSCMVRLIFEGPGSCVAAPVAPVEGLPGLALSIPAGLTAERDGKVLVPIHLATGGSQLNSLIFSLDYDESTFAFDPTDADHDGVPDAVRIDLGATIRSVTVNSDDAYGELDFIFTSFSSVPFPDGIVAEVELEHHGSSSEEVAMRLSRSPAPSFGGVSGQSLPGQAHDGSVVFNLIFFDGFESGDLSRWVVNP